MAYLHVVSSLPDVCPRRQLQIKGGNTEDLYVAVGFAEVHPL